MHEISFIDHYDSFSYNVLDWLWRGGLDPKKINHIYCDDHPSLEAVAREGCPVVFGPGPHAPSDVPSSLDVASKLLGKVPLFGVCLGHQIFGYVTGGAVKRSNIPWHGHAHEIRIMPNSVMFRHCSDQFLVGCYHSLVVDVSATGSEWDVCAVNLESENMAMALRNVAAPAWSTQYHPESFLSQNGAIVLKNWLDTWR